MPRPRATTPPSGAPAQRSALSIGSRRPGDPDDDRTSLVSRNEPSASDRWKNALVVLRRRGLTRWGLLGALTLLQAFLLFSAVMWWLGWSTPSATANVAPQTWTGVVYDVGAAGVNMRSAPQVRPDDSRDTAARGARLALSCGETGDIVTKGPIKTATWVKTTDGMFVSMLYIRVPDKASIPSCNGSKVDGPLLALADPAHPELPPPPGTQIGGGGKPDAATDPRTRSGQSPAVRAAGAAPQAPVGSPAAAQAGVPAPNTSVVAKAQAPAAGTSMGSVTNDSHNVGGSTVDPRASPLDHADSGTNTVTDSHFNTAHTDPNITPVG